MRLATLLKAALLILLAVSVPEAAERRVTPQIKAPVEHQTGVEGGSPTLTITVERARAAIVKYVAGARDEVGCDWDIDFGAKELSASGRTIDLTTLIVVTRVICRTFERKVIGDDGNIRIEKQTVRERLDRTSATFALSLEIIVRGIMAIQSGENPRVVEQKLNTFLPPKLRASEEAA